MDCEVCFERYDEEDRQPRTMPCGHTLCTVCITRNIEGKQLICPFCRKIYFVAAVTDIPVSFTILKMLRLVTKDEIVPANCKGNYLKSPTKHSYSNLEPELHAGICAEHGSYSLFFCMTCNLWICRDCTVVKHPVAKCNVSSIREALDQIIDKETFHLTQAMKTRSVHITQLKEYQTKLKSCYEKQDGHLQSFTQVVEHIKSVMNLLKMEQNRVETVLSDGKIVIKKLKLANENLVKKDSVEDIKVASNLSQQRRKEVKDWLKTSEDDLKVAEIQLISEELSMTLDLKMKRNGIENMHTSNVAGISSFINSLEKLYRSHNINPVEENDVKCGGPPLRLQLINRSKTYVSVETRSIEAVPPLGTTHQPNIPRKTSVQFKPQNIEIVPNIGTLEYSKFFLEIGTPVNNSSSRYPPFSYDVKHK